MEYSGRSLNIHEWECAGSNSTVSVSFRDAMKAARRSHLYKFRTGAAIYDGRWNLLSMGWSHIPTSPLVTTPRSKHAEHHAIERCSEIQRARYITVATISRRGNVTCAAPCPSCYALLRRYDLIVRYTDWFNKAPILPSDRV